MNVGSLTVRAARAWPGRIAVRATEGTLTFAQLDERAARFAGAMAELGLRPGDRVAVLVSNRTEWFDTTFGLMRAGLVRNYINPRHDAAEIGFQLRHSGSRALIVSSDYRPLLDGADLAAVEHIVEVGADYEERLARADPDTAVVGVPDDHPLEIRYTSGTTGQPKGVVQTHRSYMGLTRGILAHIAWGTDDRILHVGPLSHGFGAYSPVFLATGSEQVVHPGFEPAAIVEDVDTYGITTLSLVPTMIYMLLDVLQDGRARGASLRTILYGTAPMSPDRLRQGLELLGPVFVQSYGMSEVLGGMTILSREDHIEGGALLSSCGRPSLLGEVMVADDDGREVPAGEVGEIYMRGPTMLKEYWDAPEQTAAALTEDGWFRSGDMARRDERGYVYIVDRKGDMIVSGGFNVSPVEVEHVLMAHPAVQEAAVVAVPHPTWGEAVKGVVRLRDGQTADEPEIVAWAREHLVGYKVPKSIDFSDDVLPRNVLGKLLRRVVREPYWQGQERRVG